MRTYPETLDFLYSRLPMFTRVGAAAYKNDLGNTQALCRLLDNPEHKFKSVHIAGTNGKGSSSHMLASVLQAQGYKTGLYTSPHLRDFRERIRINGEMIPEEEVVLFTQKMEANILEIEPSFFELTMVMAFDYFARQKVDIAIIEAGMGGRLDSTNVIKPELCLITNIGFDHVEFLGNDLASIASEKAGIIKAETPVIIGKTQNETREVFLNKAAEMDAPVFFADTLWTCTPQYRSEDFQHYLVQGPGHEKYALELDLMGHYQAANLPGVLEVIRQLIAGKFSIDASAVRCGLREVHARTGLMGRWQLLSKNPRVICDVGHNEDGIKEVIRMLDTETFKTLHFVVGMVRDKEVEKVLNLLPKNAVYYFTQASIPRAMPVEELCLKARKHGLRGESWSKVSEAFNAAKQAAEENDLVFVGGSTFVVAEVV